MVLPSTVLNTVVPEAPFSSRFMPLNSAVATIVVI